MSKKSETDCYKRIQNYELTEFIKPERWCRFIFVSSKFILLFRLTGDTKLRSLRIPVYKTVSMKIDLGTFGHNDFLSISCHCFLLAVGIGMILTLWYCDQTVRHSWFILGPKFPQTKGGGRCGHRPPTIQSRGERTLEKIRCLAIRKRAPHFFRTHLSRKRCIVEKKWPLSNVTCLSPSLSPSLSISTGKDVGFRVRAASVSLAGIGVGVRFEHWYYAISKWSWLPVGLFLIQHKHTVISWWRILFLNVKRTWHFKVTVKDD